ncbi:uncharacterized protein LOC6506183 isoform X9 [Drosophila ananassae]|uniref:uncharacterized protein LOC6506183 isoform X9 n=1 Tax=Drosophila ananassae TaxID=7217 RepID=UPI0013A5C37B|nr:uncharacterized protein LOC6506183 isoform X9 [Drosophila ananassae]
MSRNKAAAVSAFRLLLRPSTAPRSRNLLALRLAPVTTFALHLRPGHEMQQHRGYASSAQDDETKGGQKSDQHQKQLETGGPKSCQDEAEAKSNKYHLSSRDDESDNAIGSKNPASSLVSAELREEVRRLVRQLFERLRSRETCSRSESRVIKCPRSEGYKNAVPNHNSDELSCQKEVMGDRAGSQAPGKLANRIEKFKKRRSHKPARVKVLNARELAHIKRELCKQMQSKKKVTSRSRKKARMKLDQAIHPSSSSWPKPVDTLSPLGTPILYANEATATVGAPEKMPLPWSMCVWNKSAKLLEENKGEQSTTFCCEPGTIQFLDQAKGDNLWSADAVFFGSCQKRTNFLTQRSAL